MQAAPQQQAQNVRRKTQMKGQFTKELRPLMYSFGDDVNPDPEATNVLEEILIDYITEICYKSQKASGNRGKIKIEDIKFVLRNDPKKLNRVEELLYMQEDIKRARAAFNEGDIIQDAVKANNRGTKRPGSPGN